MQPNVTSILMKQPDVKKRGDLSKITQEFVYKVANSWNQLDYRYNGSSLQMWIWEEDHKRYSITKSKGGFGNPSFDKDSFSGLPELLIHSCMHSKYYYIPAVCWIICVFKYVMNWADINQENKLGESRDVIHDDTCDIWCDIILNALNIYNCV